MISNEKDVSSTLNNIIKRFEDSEKKLKFKLSLLGILFDACGTYYSSNFKREKETVLTKFTQSFLKGLRIKKKDHVEILTSNIYWKNIPHLFQPQFSEFFIYGAQNENVNIILSLFSKIKSQSTNESRDFFVLIFKKLCEFAESQSHVEK